MAHYCPRILACCVQSSRIQPKSAANDTMKMITFDYQWVIDNSFRNFINIYRNNIINTNSSLSSANFLSSEKFEYQFYLSISSNKLSCNLLKSSNLSEYHKFDAHIRVDFLDKQGESKLIKETHHEFSYECSTVEICSFNYGFSNHDLFTNRVEQFLYLVDKPSFVCQLKIVYDSAHTDTDRLVESIGSLTTDQTLDDLKLLLTTGKLSDTVLVVGGKSIPAHKAILSARSKVFAAMFEYDSMEKQENRVVITDVKFPVLEELLKFIYTGKIAANVLDQYAEELLAAADKYQLDSLKDICELALCLKISTESAPSFLILADMHNAQKLKAKALEFIRDNTNDTIQAVFNSNKPELVVEAFRNLANKKE